MNEDQKWQKLLSHSASTFTGEATPPYGFVTATLARLKAEERNQLDAERIGWRALLASFAALVIAATVTLTVNFSNPSSDFEPGVKSMVQMDNIQLS